MSFDPGEVPSLLVLVVGTFAGGVLPLLGRWRRDTLSVLLAFGSGVLLAVIFLQMIPPVVGFLGAWGGLVILGGFVSTSLLETGLHAHRHTGGHGESGGGEAFSAPFGATGVAVAIGLGLHSVLDGLALGTGMGLSGLAPSLFLAILI
ncbi:MAG: ZIP family metal transporter, partial [Acidobacteriota bacterium]